MTKTSKAAIIVDGATIPINLAAHIIRQAATCHNEVEEWDVPQRCRGSFINEVGGHDNCNPTTCPDTVFGRLRALLIAAGYFDKPEEGGR